jgi:hypothetical protein
MSLVLNHGGTENTEKINWKLDELRASVVIFGDGSPSCENSGDI